MELTNQHNIKSQLKADFYSKGEDRLSNHGSNKEYLFSLYSTKINPVILKEAL